MKKGSDSWSSYWSSLISERNTDEVECAGYLAIGTTVNLSLMADGNVATLYLNKNNLNIIRQSGNLTKVQFRVAVNTGAIGKLIIMVVRKDGTNYDRIGYEDFGPQITVTNTYTFAFATPIAVLEGDYIAIGGTRGGTNGNNICATTGFAATSNRYGDMNPIPDQDYDWDSKSSGTWIVPVKAYIQAPVGVVIGDSVTCGHGTPAGASYIENYLYSTKERLLGYLIQQINGDFVQQTMGIGSQTTTQIAARFAADCVALKPKIAVINGGVNDIAGGTISKSTFLSNWTTMLNACATAGIIPVVCKILPWTSGTNEQMQTRDEWMADLQTLAATYTGSVWVDFDTDMGKFRVGGDEGNLWDLQTDPDYDDDGVHPTLLGYQKMAEVVYREIRKVWK